MAFTARIHRSGTQLTNYLFWGNAGEHFEGVNVLCVNPPQETLLVEKTEELVCCRGGESLRKDFPE